jgi:hypothetical protein
LAKGWTKSRRCPICDLAGWGDKKCRGFEHRDGGAVYCEHPQFFHEQESKWVWEQTEVVISPFGIPLTCFRKVLG